MAKKKEKEKPDMCKIMDFNLKQCETFCKVVDLKSFSKAADELHITQASASERVANLESIIGVKLLDRLGRQIVPSSAGKMLYDRAVQMLEFKKRACQEMNEFLGVQRGLINIGGSTIPGEYILPGLIGEFRSEYPDIQVLLKVGDTREVTSGVIEGEYELGIVGSKDETTSLHYDRLWDDELVLAVRADHSWTTKKNITIKDLIDEPFIMREPGSGTRRIVQTHLGESLSLNSSDLNIVAMLGSSTAVKEGIKKGLGVAIVSKWAIETELKAGILKIVPIRNLQIHRNFYLIQDKRRVTSPICESFREFLLQKTYEK